MFARFYLILCLMIFSFICSSQEAEKIRFSKDKDKIYFFQKGAKCDTLVRGRSDVYYFLVPDSLKSHIFISTENARFVKGDNDSLVVCKHTRGMRYESDFFADKQVYNLRTAPNGAASFPPNKVLIEVIDRRTDKVLIKNELTVKP